MKPSRIALGLLAAAALVAGRPVAQEQEQGPRPLPPEVLGGPSDPEQELRRLFREVERTLRRIDDQLFDAAAGEADLGGVDAEIDRLLRETEAASRSAVEGIDRILQVASQMNQGGGGQGSSSNDRSGQGQPQGGQSPIDQQPQGQERQERMQGEQAPQQDQGQGQEPSQQSQDPGQEQPRDGSASEQEGRNAPGQDPNQGERGARSSAEGADRWGDLPPRVQTIFQNQVNDDLPVRYRQWIDRYHRRLNG